MNYFAKRRCRHDLPYSYNWQDCIFRCSFCDSIFHSVIVDYGTYYESVWKRRSERWLEKRINLSIKNLENRIIGGTLLDTNSHTEELVCEACSKTWQRQKTRGRKPRLCPTCLTSPVQVQNNNDKKTEFQISYPAPTKWICPICAVSISVYVSLENPPTHICKSKLSQNLPLQLIS